MIKIICVGKIKEAFYRDAIAEYLKRMSKYHKVEIVEVADSNIKAEKNEMSQEINKKQRNIKSYLHMTAWRYIKDIDDI